ncbi:MAG TPA: hypothetical protein VIJ01_18550 [Candidatus Angelobacter sp.]
MTAVAEVGATGASMTPPAKLMQRNTPKIVLILIVLMAVLSPFMQLDSLDNFPMTTGDMESHLISVLFEIGMFFVFTGILKLFPSLLCTNVRPPSMIFLGFTRDVAPLQLASSCFAVPLRI